MNTPHESTESDSIAQSTRDDHGESFTGSGCVLPFLSLLVFYTLHDAAVVEALRLHALGFRRLPMIVKITPLSCLVAWLVVFHAPIGNRLRLAPLRAIRRLPALARHLLLWIVLIAAVLATHYLAQK